jgi:hypothetical protein
MARSVPRHETELRTFLRLSLSPEHEGQEPRRGLTNRGRWINSLLEGLSSDVPTAARDRLAAALVPLFGADAIVWTTDMAELPHDQAIEPPKVPIQGHQAGTSHAVGGTTFEP